MRRRWTDRYWPAFLVALAIGFVVPEAIALFDGDPATLPLTNWSIGKGLGEAFATLGLWLALHFGIRLIRR